jgi:hypothetical protein
MLHDAAAINVKIAKENKATTKIAEFNALEKAISSFNPEVSVHLPERSWLDLRFEDFLYCLIELWIHGLHVVDGQKFVSTIFPPSLVLLGYHSLILGSQ